MHIIYIFYNVYFIFLLPKEKTHFAFTVLAYENI